MTLTRLINAPASSRCFIGAMLAGLFCLAVTLPPAAVAAANAAAVAAAAPAPEQPVASVLFTNGTSSISRAIVRAGPDWTPDKPLPLKPEAAARIAIALIPKISPKYAAARWYVTGVKLTPLFGTGYLKWYYTIDLKTDAHTQQLTDALVIFIAMDGTPGELKLH